MYYHGEVRWDEAYPYILVIDNMSQTVAMCVRCAGGHGAGLMGARSYCLVLFYFAIQDELAHINPVPKFLVVKSVVFFTFWVSPRPRLDLPAHARRLCSNQVTAGLGSHWRSNDPLAVALTLAVRLGILEGSPAHSADDQAKGLQGFMVCVEMFIASIAHHVSAPA
jgi:hypothetical protein